MTDNKDAEIKKAADWSPIATYEEKRVRPSSGADHIGAGCGNIARAIVIGLTYVGDCIKDLHLKGK